ncbi:cytochrome c [Candidatus Nitronereus thalassa]|uniref:Cytochrome c n=1 Tax=Candidatus Nitronereus thalassa TaxID=3020898 RepID=A0ABU3KBQ2_9BACT|nr:cytochrome c [Candidatus Nitronereus thalassa]MDT7043659.1 cytochrome c [Candidatus Nitronereus thalassa]
MMVFSFIWTPLLAQEFEPLRPRVPVEERSMARKMLPPFGSTKRATPSIIAEGKALYEGKGTCISCHGESGLGDGEVGRSLNPSPRNFTNCRFHARRRDGELFWILKNGSPGTGMVPMIPVTITEEEAWKILAYERSFCRDWQR